MRLEQVHVRGYRCLRDVVLDFDDLTILLGGNSTQSSLLKALAFGIENAPVEAAICTPARRAVRSS